MEISKTMDFCVQIFKRSFCLFSFLFVNICTSNAQQWVWDEISKEDEGGPFSGIFGALLLFFLIWLFGRFFGGKDKDNNSSPHINDVDTYFYDEYVDDDDRFE